MYRYSVFCLIVASWGQDRHYFQLHIVTGGGFMPKPQHFITMILVFLSQQSQVPMCDTMQCRHDTVHTDRTA